MKCAFPREPLQTPRPSDDRLRPSPLPAPLRPLGASHRRHVPRLARHRHDDGGRHRHDADFDGSLHGLGDFGPYLRHLHDPPQLLLRRGPDPRPRPPLAGDEPHPASRRLRLRVLHRPLDAPPLGRPSGQLARRAPSLRLRKLRPRVGRRDADPLENDRAAGRRLRDRGGRPLQELVRRDEDLQRPHARRRRRSARPLRRRARDRDPRGDARLRGDDRALRQVDRPGREPLHRAPRSRSRGQSGQEA